MSTLEGCPMFCFRFVSFKHCTIFVPKCSLLFISRCFGFTMRSDSPLQLLSVWVSSAQFGGITSIEVFQLSSATEDMYSCDEKFYFFSAGEKRRRVRSACFSWQQCGQKVALWGHFIRGLTLFNRVTRGAWLAEVLRRWQAGDRRPKVLFCPQASRKTCLTAPDALNSLTLSASFMLCCRR